MSLFDTNGNIRSRFSNDSLMLLMRAMQAWLRRGSNKNFRPFGSCFEFAQCNFRSENKARKAGIDRDSIAHRNGRRRRQESDARACMTRSKLIDCSLNGCPRNLNGSWHYSSAAQGSPSTRDLKYFDQEDPSDLKEIDGYDDELAAERARRLKDLLSQLNERTCLTSDPYYLIEAIKNIQVGKPQRKSVK
ncbi:hypothetical protein KR038_009098 [Drosophila bunnanda]|nr:hypothetical protein KR038_009098 [Drosophila bunnanda]